jgi:hypothetical protein
MTDRINSILVVLEHDMRDDDVQTLMKAIGQFRNVLKVTGNVSDISNVIAEARAKQEIMVRVFAAIQQGSK